MSLSYSFPADDEFFGFMVEKFDYNFEDNSTVWDAAKTTLEAGTAG